MIQGVSLFLFPSPKFATDRHLTQFEHEKVIIVFIQPINFFYHRVTLLVAMELEADLFTASSSRTRTSSSTTPAPESSPWPTPARIPTDPRYDPPLETTTHYITVAVLSILLSAQIEKLGSKETNRWRCMLVA